MILPFCLLIVSALALKGSKPSNLFRVPKVVTTGLLSAGLLLPNIKSCSETSLSPYYAECAVIRDKSSNEFCGKEQSEESCSATKGELHINSKDKDSSRKWAMSLSFGGFAVAGDYDKNWSDRQRLAAETWRAVDEAFNDRSFNGQDWFKLRQSVVKRSYNSDEELYKALRDMMAKLGDKYTRYLAPAQYRYVYW